MKARARPPAFSVATVVRNESRSLPRLLESLSEFRSQGGEIVVLDTGSTDDTVRIAKLSGCRVTLAPRRFNRRLSVAQARAIETAFARGGDGPLAHAGERSFAIAEARNAANRLARHPIILSVDASDVIEAMDLTFIDNAIRSRRADILGFETRRLNHDQWVLEQRDYFHDRRTAVWRGRAHNFVAPRNAARSLVTGLLPRDRLRVTHFTDATKDRGYQLTGLALDVLEAPDFAHRRLLLGYELAARGHTRSAIALFETLDHAGVALSFRSAALASCASCLTTLGGDMSDTANDLLFKATRRDPTRRGPLLQIARAMLSAGQLQSAVSFAAAALAIPARVTSTEPEQNLRQGPHEILYWALWWLGRTSEARAHFSICQQLDPGNALYLEHARLFA